MQSGRMTKPYLHHGLEIKDLLQSPLSLSGPKTGILSKVCLLLLVYICMYNSRFKIFSTGLDRPSNLSTVSGCACGLPMSHAGYPLGNRDNPRIEQFQSTVELTMLVMKGMLVMFGSCKIGISSDCL